MAADATILCCALRPPSGTWIQIDELQKNRHDSEKNHTADFNVQTFAKPSEVLSPITQGQQPDALLVDVFFYDTEKQAQEVEDVVAAQTDKLGDRLRSVVAGIILGGHGSAQL